MDRLVVQICVWLWQVANEAPLKAKLFRSGGCVLGTARAPQIQDGARRMKRSNSRDHARHGNSLRADGPNERVINVDKNNARFHGEA